MTFFGKTETRMKALLDISTSAKKSWADELSHYSTCVFFSTRGRSEKYQEEEKSSEDDDDTLRSIDID